MNLIDELRKKYTCKRRGTIMPAIFDRNGDFLTITEFFENEKTCRHYYIRQYRKWWYERSEF